MPVSSTRVAEMVKLLENTFRAVNIGLVNELALMCDRMNIDVWEVVDAAKTKPFGFMAFYPGPGLGGHCIPIDPFYLSWKAKQTGFDPRFIELAGHINARHAALRRRQGRRGAEHAAQGDQRLARSSLLGVAYKRDIDDMRESPALDVMGLLLARGAKIAYADPYVPEVHGREWSGGYDIKAVDDARAARSPSTTASSSSPITRRSTTRRSSRKRTSSSTRATRSSSPIRTSSSSARRAPRKAKKSPWPDRSLFCRT